MTKAKYITVIGFVLLISSQLIFSLLGINFNEKTFQKKPSFSLEKIVQKPNVKEKAITFFQQGLNYRDDMYHYFTRNFSLKTPLVKTHQFIQKDIFDVDPIPDEVINGKEGWMFLGNESLDVILNSKGFISWNSEKLIATKNHLTEMKKWCEERGIQFYLIVAPNKHSVYGEYLPIKKAHRKTKLEVLTTQMKDLNFNTVDLSTLLQNKKQENQVYHKIDSHWNELGAFWAYEALINVIKNDYPIINPLSINDFTFSKPISGRHDLANLLMDTTKEVSIKFNWKEQPQAKSVSKTLEEHKHIFNENIYNSRYKSDVNSLKAVVLGDSFSQALRPYLRESFGETVFLRYLKFDRHLLKLEKPDIVVIEIVERNIDDLINL